MGKRWFRFACQAGIGSAPGEFLLDLQTFRRRQPLQHLQRPQALACEDPELSWEAFQLPGAVPARNPHLPTPT